MDDDLSLGEDEEERPRRRGLRDPQQARRLVVIMLVYGVALIVVSVAYGYLTLPSKTAPADVPCGLGELPATVSSAELALAATDASYPPPSNGSLSPQEFTLWLNSTDRLLPGTQVAFSVVSLPGTPGGPSCRLPISSSRWSALPTTETLQPNTFETVSFVGYPSSDYGRDGIYAVQLWVNTTGGSPSTLGAIHTELDVS